MTREEPAHRALLERRGVPVPAREALSRYLELVERWSRRLNLTAARTPAQRVETLVGPALAAERFVEGPSLVDIGSGAGTPGLILALLRPELHVTLLEPRTRRWAFLREACRTLERRDVRVEACRHDEWAGGPARTVTVRAVRVAASELASCCEPGGRVIVIGTLPAPLAPLEAEGGDPGASVHALRAPVPRETRG